MPYLQPAEQMLPFQSGSETSRKGAEFVKPRAGSQRDTLLAFYRLCGEQGATDHEASVWTGFSRSTLCARRNELMKAELVTKAEGQRRPGEYGTSQQVWIAR